MMLVPSRRLFITGVGSLIAAPALINHAMKLRGSLLDPWVVAFDLGGGTLVRSQFDSARNSFPSFIDKEAIIQLGAAQRVTVLNKDRNLNGIRYQLIRESELKTPELYIGHKDHGSYWC